MGFGMRCHDLCEKQSLSGLAETIEKNHIQDVQLALKKSINNIDTSYGRYSPGLAEYIRKEPIRSSYSCISARVLY